MHLFSTCSQLLNRLGDYTAPASMTASRIVRLACMPGRTGHGQQADIDTLKDHVANLSLTIQVDHGVGQRDRCCHWEARIPCLTLCGRLHCWPRPLLGRNLDSVRCQNQATPWPLELGPATLGRYDKAFHLLLGRFASCKRTVMTLRAHALKIHHRF